MQNRVLLIFFISFSLSTITTERKDIPVESTSSDDTEFFNSLFSASQDDDDSDNELEQTMQALADMEAHKKEVAEENASRLKKYATMVAVKTVVCYSTCKTYLSQWLASINAYIFGEK